MPEMDYTAWRFWLDMLQVLFTFAVGIYVWIDRGRATNHKLIRTVTARQEDFDRRLIKAEEQMKNLPNHEDIDALESRLSAVQADMAGLRATLQGVQSTSDRIYDYLLNNGK